MPSAPSVLHPCRASLPLPHHLSWGQAHLWITGRIGGVTPGISCPRLAHGSLKERRQSSGQSWRGSGTPWTPRSQVSRAQQQLAHATEHREQQGMTLNQELGSHPSPAGSAYSPCLTRNSLPSPPRQGQLQANLLLDTLSKESSPGSQRSLPQRWAESRSLLHPQHAPRALQCLRQVLGDLGTVQANLQALTAQPCTLSAEPGQDFHTPSMKRPEVYTAPCSELTWLHT